MDDIVKNFLIEKLEKEIQKAEGEAEKLGKWNAKCKSLQGEWRKVKGLIGEENRGKIGREKIYKCLNLTGEWLQLAKQASECCKLLKQPHKLSPKTLQLPFHELGGLINQVKKELEDSIKSQQQQQQQQQEQQQQVKKDIEDSVKAQQQQQQQQSSSPKKPEIYRWSYHKSPPQKKVHGFEDKIKVMERLLLKKETMAIGISGVAGVGKTVLAQEAYNDASVKAQFLLRMWLCMSKQQGIVSEDPEKRMLRCLGFEGDVIEKVGAVKLRPVLRQQLKRGRFLIVLDDVWAVEEIDKAEYKELISFLTADCGEGKVIVTSRSPELEQVVGKKGITQRLLPLIADSDSCWKIFEDALGKEVTPEMKGLKKKIVEKCEGLPLMAEMLGKYGTA